MHKMPFFEKFNRIQTNATVHFPHMVHPGYGMAEEDGWADEDSYQRMHLVLPPLNRTLTSACSNLYLQPQPHAAEISPGH